jgi:glutamate synthase (NADPH/NADH) small chain
LHIQHFIFKRRAKETDNVFFAGDAANGASLVVRAMADGIKVAAQVDQYLLAR